jgi:hypothetical protein
MATAPYVMRSRRRSPVGEAPHSGIIHHITSMILALYNVSSSYKCPVEWGRASYSSRILALRPCASSAFLLDLFRGGNTCLPAHLLASRRPAPPRDQQEQPMPQPPSSSPTVTVFRSPGERIGCGPRDHNSGVASIYRNSSAWSAHAQNGWRVTLDVSTYPLHEFPERLDDVDVGLCRALCGGGSSAMRSEPAAPVHPQVSSRNRTTTRTYR